MKRLLLWQLRLPEGRDSLCGPPCGFLDCLVWLSPVRFLPAITRARSRSFGHLTGLICLSIWWCCCWHCCFLSCMWPCVLWLPCLPCQVMHAPGGLRIRSEQCTSPCSIHCR